MDFGFRRTLSFFFWNGFGVRQGRRAPNPIRGEEMKKETREEQKKRLWDKAVSKKMKNEIGAWVDATVDYVEYCRREDMIKQCELFPEETK